MSDQETDKQGFAAKMEAIRGKAREDEAKRQEERKARREKRAEKIKAAFTWVKDTVNDWRKKDQEAGAALRMGAKMAPEVAKAAVSSGVSTVVEAGQGAIADVQEKAGEVKNAVVGGVEKGILLGLGLGTLAVEAGGNVISEGIERGGQLKDNVVDAAGRAVGWAEEKWNDTLDKGAEVVSDVIETVGRGVDGIKKRYSEKKRSLRERFQRAVDNIKGIADDVKEGINTRVSQAHEASERAKAEFYATAREALGRGIDALENVYDAADDRAVEHRRKASSIRRSRTRIEDELS